MKIIYNLALITLLISCNNKEILVPKSDLSLINNVTDFTTVSMLYEENDDKNIEIHVKSNSLITQTNWIFEIDKRLPLKLVIPEVKKLQEKKSKKSENVVLENYFTYADTLSKNISFLPFSSIKFEKSNKNFVQNSNRIDVIINREGEISLNDKKISENDIKTYLENKYPKNQATLYLSFDEKLTFDNYVKTKLIFEKIKLENIIISSIEVVY